MVLSIKIHQNQSLYAECQENSARNDLTKGQRKAYAAEVGKLLAKIDDDRNSASGRVGWLKHLAEQTGTPLRTAERWWAAFCEETGRTITSRQALDYDREEFFGWLQEQRANRAITDSVG